MGKRFGFDFDDGHVIDGRYVLEAEIGRGAMGCVYKAMDEKLERPVAVKFLDPNLVTDDTAVTRFQREALAAGLIGHPNICDVRDRGETDDGVPYIVMELLVGQPLSDLLTDEERMDPLRMGRLTIQMLSALAAAHEKGIIHRDLKPANIFVVVGPDGNEWVKLLDFGISKFIYDDQHLKLTNTGAILGTPYYMSPEHTQEPSKFDHRADLWSICAILYEGLTGNLPFQGQSYHEVLVKIILGEVTPPTIYEPALSPEYEAVIMRGFAPDIDDRFSNAKELAESLHDALLPLDDRSSLAGFERTSRPPSQPTPARTENVAEVSAEEAETRPETPPPEPLPPVPSASSEAGEREPSAVSVEPEPRGKSKRWVGAVVVAGLLAAVGGAFLYATIRGTDASEPSTERVNVASAESLPATPAESAEASEQPAQREAPAEEARPSVEVRLTGLPDGATATFDETPVRDGVITGVEGQEGLLVVEAEGYETARIDLALASGEVLDLEERLVPASTRTESSDQGGDVEVTDEDRAERGSRERRDRRRRDGAGRTAPLLTDYEDGAARREGRRPAKNRDEVLVIDDYEE